MDDIKRIEVYKKGEFSKWLKKNGTKEEKVNVIIHKKHTGKSNVNSAGLMREAICFGWIDTTVHRLDEDRFIVKYSKRTQKSRWSRNTLRYAKELIEEGKMSAEGIKFYRLGLAKLPHDHGLPINPRMPKDLKSELMKHKVAKKNFSNFPKSVKKMYYRWILKGKQEETRRRRIKSIIETSTKNKKLF